MYVYVNHFAVHLKLKQRCKQLYLGWKNTKQLGLFSVNQDRAWWVDFHRVTPLRSLSCWGQHDLPGTGRRCAHQTQRLEADDHLVTFCCCCCSVSQSSLTLCHPVDHSMPGFPDHHHLTVSRSPPKPMSTESVVPSNRLSLCRPRLLLPSIFPGIRGFFSESALLISWPEYWSLTFRFGPSDACARNRRTVRGCFQKENLCRTHEEAPLRNRCRG